MTLLDLSSVRDSPIAPTTWEGTFSIPQGWEQEYVPLNRTSKYALCDGALDRIAHRMRPPVTELFKTGPRVSTGKKLKTANDDRSSEEQRAEDGPNDLP